LSLKGSPKENLEVEKSQVKELHFNH
jgi:hypothetical protein